LNLEDEANAATAGLIGSGLSKEAVLGIIQDEDSCQDSDFSGDEEKVVPPATGVVPSKTDEPSKPVDLTKLKNKDSSLAVRDPVNTAPPA
jgi:hypothetical protein